MKIHVKSKEWIENSNLPGRSIIISVCNPFDNVVEIQDKKNVISILRLYYWNAMGTTKGFTPVHAAAIWNFIFKKIDYLENLIIQCETGYDKSATIAAAISEKLCGNNINYFTTPYNPNIPIYNVLLRKYSDIDKSMREKYGFVEKKE